MPEVVQRNTSTAYPTSTDGATPPCDDRHDGITDGEPTPSAVLSVDVTKGRLAEGDASSPRGANGEDSGDVSCSRLSSDASYKRLSLLLRDRRVSLGSRLLSTLLKAEHQWHHAGIEQSKVALRGESWQGLLFQGGSSLKKFRQWIGVDPTVLTQRDAAGATPLHLMLLYNTELHMKLASEVIRKYPERCADQYIGGVQYDKVELHAETNEERITQTWIPDEYTGENSLHIAIVNRNIEMARQLIDACPDQLEHHAVGEFFSPEGHCYYGELPLSFAVCTNQPDMVRLLLAKGADLDRVDNARGNTALHMAVLLGLAEMFDLLRAEWAARKPGKPQWWGVKECISDRPNNEGQTCISLAAAEGSVDMFDHVLSSRGTLMWAYGPVTCTLYPVEGLDTGFPSARSNMLEQGRSELLSLPRIRRLQELKWEVFGRQKFARRFVRHVFLLCVLQISLVQPRQSISRATLAAIAADWWLLLRPACEAILLISAVCKLNTELRELSNAGFRQYFGMGRASVFENVASLIYCFSMISVFIARAKCGIEDVALEDIALVVAVFTKWIYSAFFMLGFHLSGPFIISAFEMMSGDIPTFLTVVSIFMCAFSSAMYILSGKLGFQFLLNHFEFCLMALLGQADFQHFDEPRQVCCVTYRCSAAGLWVLLDRMRVPLVN